MRVTHAVVFELTLGMLGLLGFFALNEGDQTVANAAELKLPEGSTVQWFDFEQRGIEGWKTVDSKWTVEEIPGAPSRKKVLVQRAVENQFNVIVAPGGPYTDVDVSVRFKPMSGREDASGGIVFRFAEGRYYLVRANALKDNLTLYYYDQGRQEITSQQIAAPPLGRWHKLRVTAEGERIHGWLND